MAVRWAMIWPRRGGERGVVKARLYDRILSLIAEEEARELFC
jgi:hypothetical protein